jgi:hypothetical protein
MNNQEIAEYIRDRYSREENLLLTLVSCALIMDAEMESDKNLSPAIVMVGETLQTLRESLSEQELLTVSMLLAEINRLQDDD